MTIGYTKPLYVLPFDHRSSFEKGLFGLGGPPDAQATGKIAGAKQVIYQAFRLALERGADRTRAAILVDEQFGAAILRDAASRGLLTAMPVEKSGQAEFEFEFGEEFAAHIEQFRPTFVKALVRYNPEGDAELNRRQAARLRRLSQWLHRHSYRFMFELLVPPTHEQVDRLEGDQQLFDRGLRPSLMIGGIKELQNAGVEPDVWKVEGLDFREDCVKVAEAARWGGRDAVGCIVLGRGSNARKVLQWLRNAAGVPGFIGFAVGRTSFWEPLVALRDGKISARRAAGQIARRYLRWVAAFERQQAV